MDSPRNRTYLQQVECLWKVCNVTEPHLDVATLIPSLAADRTAGGDYTGTIITTILCLFSVVGTLGNGLVLYVFTRTTGKLTSTVFILALAGTDFVTCLAIIPLTVIAIHVQYELMYDGVCKLYQFLITCTVPLSAFIMVAIAVDRYICICHPFSHVMTVLRAKVIVGVVACFAVILGIITALGHGVYQVVNRNETRDLPYNESISSNIDFGSNENYTRDHVLGGKSIVGAPYNVVNYQTVAEVVYNGTCYPNAVIVSGSFTEVYQKIYSSFYLCSLIIVLILYCLIYSSVTRQRAKRRAQKKESRVKQVNMQCQTDESTMPLSHTPLRKTKKDTVNNLHVEMEGQTVSTKLTISNNHENGSTEMLETKPICTTVVRRSDDVERQKEKKDHYRLANIKTAIMLFIVTIVFIIAFLPGWLMAHEWLAFDTIVFYMYFVYNVANPVIYAFMNQMFRDNLCKIISSCRMYYRSREN
ncbi:uncharacterized protein LOC127831540 [Dreissena polymorpha]|uniref:G-protein coupled receptors family 1 profile domain-containing protein n=1 Tax=Dreissena polymorpha TaxID=45954 RepID=A0A9D4JYB9_DREPO|nr:uncharacterized protein LOC127831540 [Dreissena polymorpha]KAH3827584.1 hypothetical protein DPMN_129521 [Dreissena polymorpha]